MLFTYCKYYMYKFFSQCSIEAKRSVQRKENEYSVPVSVTPATRSPAFVYVCPVVGKVYDRVPMKASGTSYFEMIALKALEHETDMAWLRGLPGTPETGSLQHTDRRLVIRQGLRYDLPHLRVRERPV